MKVFGGHSRFAVRISAIGLLVLVVGAAAARPLIQHDPVKIALRGQPITVLARVSDQSSEVKSVTLFYSVSKDMAPFRVVMQSSGEGVYVATIPAEHFDKASQVFYYVEAANVMDEVRETPWYTIPVRMPDQVRRGAVEPAPSPTPPGTPGTEKESSIRWGTVGLIAGGAAAVVGGAFLIGGGGDSGGDSSEGVQPGSYDGTVTECITPDGGSPECATHAMTIEIDVNGRVASDTLREGVALEDVLRGNRFTLTAPLNDPTNGVGQVEYAGTVADDTIVGVISGESMTPLGTGQFSGTFTATKRP